MTRRVWRAALCAASVFAATITAGCATRPSEEDYSAYQAALRAMGDLRTETAPPDAPFTADDLVRNFERIALRHESDARSPGSDANSTPNPLMRWEGPLNYRLFGSAVTDDDRQAVADLMGRIARLTGLRITESGDDLNFLILITTPDERADYSADLRGLNPALGETFDFWRRTPEVICVANNLFSAANSNRIVAGLVSIGSETRGLLRVACLNEEIVQALGLANDHPDVRPSIFNDDGEFALLTDHDERLLQILYNPRLEPGMTAEQAMPIVRQIVAGMDLPETGTRVAAEIPPAAPGIASASGRALSSNGSAKF